MNLVKKLFVFDLIFIFLLVKCIDVFLLVIIKMINILFDSGYFFLVWREVLVLLIFKKVGFDIVFKNYWFVSNFFFILKVIEKVVFI